MVFSNHTSGMDRIGERLISSAGSLHGHPVWYDPRGRYVTDEASGTGDFVFHRKRRSTCGMMIFLVCKSSRRPVLCTATATIAADGRLIKAPGDHCHLPELGGHGRRVRAVLENAKDSMRQQPMSSPKNTLLAARQNAPAEVAEFISLQSPIRTLRNHAAAVKSSPLEVNDIAISSQEIPGLTALRCKRSVGITRTGRRNCLSQLESNPQNSSQKSFTPSWSGRNTSGRGTSSRNSESTSPQTSSRSECAPQAE